MMLEYILEVMQKIRQWSFAICLLLVAALAVGGGSVVFAETSSSDNFQMTEMQFGGGSTLESCSEAYCAQASIGDLAVGESQGPGDTTASFGPITPDEPSLEVIVDPGESNLGLLNTENTASKTSIVRVRNYLSNGYQMQIVGESPVYSNHNLATPSSPTAAEPGTEQFGINATANTSPNIGANPVYVPSGEFSFGEVVDDYAIPNMFKYTSGETVATSDSESGRTDYTISMIVNISNQTPAGRFTGDFSVVVIPAF